MKPITILFFFYASTALAAGNGAGDFDYPELNVTPRASDRLKMEQTQLGESQFTNYLPIQISAAVTLAAGVAQLSNTNLAEDPNKAAASVGIGVGAGWLALTAVLEMTYDPYAAGLKAVGSMPTATQRDQLTRERVAEETIRDAAPAQHRLRFLSALTNLGTGVFMAIESEPGSFSRYADPAAAVIALAPLIFRSYMSDVEEQQEEYKKKIYAPVASATFLPEPATGRLSPGIAVSLRF